MAHIERPSGPQLAGVVGFFKGPNEILAAMRQVRDARYQYFDAFTPFPVHGLEAAQGLKRSPLPYVTLVAGITGFSLAFLFEYWTSAVDWPINVAGKPFNSWPAFVPIMFELTVLFAALSTVGAMLLLNGLPNIRRRAFDPNITRDRFAIVIEAPPVKYDEEGPIEDPRAKNFKAFTETDAAEFLRKLGAADVRTIYAEGWF